MAALAARSDVLGFSMPNQFAHYEPTCKPFVRTLRNDLHFRCGHNAGMARRGIPKEGAIWFLKEWMDLLGVKQRDMVDRCDWSKATASQLYTGKQDYSPKIVKEASAALNAEPFELLMPPERAMAIRRLQASAQEIVTLVHDAESAAEKHIKTGDGTNG